MYQAYKFRLYPNKEQEILIKKTFGCTRFIYNYFLEKCKEQKIKAYDMCHELKEMYEIYPWLKEVDSCSLRNAIFNLEDAYQRYYDRKGGYPNYKNKYRKQTYRTTSIRSSYKGKEYCNIEVDLKKKRIKLPKLGLMEIRGYRKIEEIEGRIINATIEKETTEKYYVSVLVEKEEEKKEKIEPETIVGIDLGIKDLVITSNGERYQNPKEINKKEKRLKRLQRKLSRQIKGSKNYQKTKVRIARIHSKIKNARRHHIVDIVNKIVKENDIIVTEKLKVKEMSQNHNLAKNILDASFYKICTQIKWKARKYGKYYYQVDTYYPSSKTCNRCGHKTDKTNSLEVREWECVECKSKHDRDINASINIMYEGIRLHYGV